MRLRLALPWILGVMGCASPLLPSGSVAVRSTPPPPEIERFVLLEPRHVRYNETLYLAPEGLEPMHPGSLCGVDDAIALEDGPQRESRCVLEPTGVLQVGGEVLLLGLLGDGFEHDGMYGHYRGVVVGLPVVETPCCEVSPSAVFTQWNHEVYDVSTTVLLHRYRVLDVDDDGRTELCIEQVFEEGPGLFEVMRMEDQDITWTPLERHVERLAFDWDPSSDRFVPASGACPAEGYAPFIDMPSFDDPVGWRHSAAP